MPLLHTHTSLEPRTECDACALRPAGLAYIITSGGHHSFLVLLLVILILPGASAMPTVQPLKVMTINATGLSHLNMCRAGISHFLELLTPHILIITETHQNPTHGDYVPRDFYRPYNPAMVYNRIVEPVAPDNMNTGVTMLIHKSIPIVRHVPTRHLRHGRGRIAVADVLVPDVNDRGRIVRVIGVYAPTNLPHLVARNGLHPFWDEVRTLAEEHTTWIMGGDINACLHARESTTANSAATNRTHVAYRDFLQATMGIDSWEQTEVRVERDWTMAQTQRLHLKRVIDRFAVSRNLQFSSTNTLRVDSIEERRNGNIPGEQSTTPFPIPYTNHRPVMTHILIGIDAPDVRQACVNRAPRRLRYPRQSEADGRYETMNDCLEKAQEERPPPHTTVTSETEYDALLKWCHTEFLRACKSAFVLPSRPAPMNPFHDSLTPPEARRIGLRIKNVGRLVSAVRHRRLRDAVLRRPALRALLDDIAPAALEETDARVLELLRTEWKRCKSAFRSALHKAQTDTAWNMHQKLRKAAIKGGPVKSLFVEPTITNPQYLRSKDDQNKLVNTPAGRLDRWTTYFDELLTRTDPPPTTKPWMTCQASTQFKQRAQGPGRFQWPQLMTTDDLHRRLLRGKRRPSPGPDGWEKWALARARQPFLELITELCNYTLANDYFPPALKASYIVPLYKKGDTTDPANYRGIVLSNCLYQIISGWFAYRVQEHAWKERMISDTQTGTQKGVRPGDMIALMDQIHKDRKSVV